MKRRHVVLFEQVKTYRGEILGVIENVTEEEAEIIPTGFHNNIRWNLGHIYLDQFLWLYALTKEPIIETSQFKQWFGFGTTPANFDSETPSFEELKRLLTIQPTQIIEVYSDRMEKEFPPTDMGMHTIEQVLIRTIFHEGMHLQAIIDILKCIQ